jgi:hypothetical protein
MYEYIHLYYVSKIKKSELSSTPLGIGYHQYKFTP